MPDSLSEREHKLKCWPEFFEQIMNGSKTFELRKDDRQPPYRYGDTLWLREWRRGTQTYTGREVRVRVTYVLSGWGLEKDYVCMGFAPVLPTGGLKRYSPSIERNHSEDDGCAVMEEDSLGGWAEFGSVSALCDTIDGLRALLREYGRHAEGCSAVFNDDPLRQEGPGLPYRCRCGWAEAEKTLGAEAGRGQG
jgi:hypothetical protein